LRLPNTTLYRFAGPVSDNSLVQHGLRHFAEARDVCAIDVVDIPGLLAKADTLIVDGLHDIHQSPFHLVIGPLQSDAILGHFQSTHRNATGVGRFARAEQDSPAQEDLDRLGSCGHVGALCHANAAIIRQRFRVLTIEFILGGARERHLAGDAPRAFSLEVGALELLGAVGLLVRSTRRAAGIGLFMLTIAVTPANIFMLHRSELFAVPLILRLPVQVGLLALIVWTTGAADFLKRG